MRRCLWFMVALNVAFSLCLLLLALRFFQAPPPPPVIYIRTADEPQALEGNEELAALFGQGGEGQATSVDRNSFGVIYVMTKSPRMADQAFLSAQSVRAIYPGMPITFFVDKATKTRLEKRERELGKKKMPYDQLVSVEDWNVPRHRLDRFSKLRSMLESPYYRTMFLDADTYFCGGNITELHFDWLDRFDLVGARAPHQKDVKSRPDGEIPRRFLELNSGMLVFRKTPRVSSFLKFWAQVLLERPIEGNGDQSPLREALWLFSDLNFYIISAEWNCRMKMSCKANPTCHVLHAHGVGQAMAKETKKEPWVPPPELWRPTKLN
ncbi:hypothetical protein QOT17_005311 [Balamuthia mandrillaris]